MGGWVGRISLEIMAHRGPILQAETDFQLSKIQDRAECGNNVFFRDPYWNNLSGMDADKLFQYGTGDQYLQFVLLLGND